MNIVIRNWESYPGGKRAKTKMTITDELLAEYYDAGLSTREIAKRAFVARQTVTNRLRAAGVTLRPRGQRPGHRFPPKLAPKSDTK